MDTIPYHIPALLPQAIDALRVRPDGVYADVTFGGGGHSRAILAALGPDGRLYGFDRDIEAAANAPADDPRFTFVHSDFRFIRNFMRFHGEERIDGVLADLGVSFHHFDSETRGFSFRSDATLDMRMNCSGGRTAADIINSYSEHDLARLFSTYADIKRPMPLVRAIAEARAQAPITNTGRLLEIASRFADPRQEKKDLARIFQALRIEVNDEMATLRTLLEALPGVLRRGGRAAIITYHSLEDRMVKNYFRSGRLDGVAEQDLFGRVSTPWKVITRQPITPDEAEIAANPRSRSAKLRVAELLQTD